MAGRFEALNDALRRHESPHLRPVRSHGAFFSLIRTDRDPEALRQALLRDHGTGVIAFPDVGAIRVAFCSLDADRMDALAQRLKAAADAL